MPMPPTEFTVIFAGWDGQEYARRYRGEFRLESRVLTVTGVEPDFPSSGPRTVTFPVERVLRVVERSTVALGQSCVVCGAELGPGATRCRTDLGDTCPGCAPVQYRTAVRGAVRVVDVWTTEALDQMTATSARMLSARV